ncbi:hypothetical protein HON22_02170 [Candidatus Peregrinibacteria bacterium]|jgi:hypothetical protein|nr:hypothetical protein [Candidatus Peregrinibacteria bacterium]
MNVVTPNQGRQVEIPESLCKLLHINEETHLSALSFWDDPSNDVYEKLL